MVSVEYRKKLIEVALPLDAINKAAAKEKSIRHNHPSTLHLWWARRPLAAARAVIFAQMVDDPSSYVEELLADPDKKLSAEAEIDKRLAENELLQGMERSLAVAEVMVDLERKRLFSILQNLVLWENTNNETVLQMARDEIWRSWRRACVDNAAHPLRDTLFNPENLPDFHDPFAGGGMLPLEAQRLGLNAAASDINPVAVLINKAMIEIPTRFARCYPVNPKWKEKLKEEKMLSFRSRAEGLAEDIRYYGNWMKEEAVRRIGHIYPKVEITAEMSKNRPDLKDYVGRKLTVIAWLWVRTVKSPNPAFADIDVPLASTFMLSAKRGKESYIEPILLGGGTDLLLEQGCLRMLTQ